MILQADGGFYLTQNYDVPIADRVFGHTTYVKDASEASKWRQVSEGEKEKMLNEGSVFDPSDLSDEYLNKVDVLLSGIAGSINSVNLTSKEKMAHKGYFPKWEDLLENPDGATSVQPGFCLSHEDVLYEVIQEHTLSRQWEPGAGTESLYKVFQVEAAGTKEDPIAWMQGMELQNGKYNKDKDVLYLCVRDSGIGMSFDLADLVSGGYVEVVDDTEEEASIQEQ